MRLAVIILNALTFLICTYLSVSLFYENKVINRRYGDDEAFDKQKKVNIFLGIAWAITAALNLVCVFLRIFIKS